MGGGEGAEEKQARRRKKDARVGAFPVLSLAARGIERGKTYMIKMSTKKES